MLDKRLNAFLAEYKRYPADLMSLMMDAGTTDLRGQEILPYALDILDKQGAEPSLNAEQATAVDSLRDWTTSGPRDPGAMRRDNNDGGEYDDCRAALLDSLGDVLAALGGDPVEQRDMISFRTLGIFGVDDILWQNRPTFQQVVSPTVSRAGN